MVGWRVYTPCWSPGESRPTPEEARVPRDRRRRKDAGAEGAAEWEKGRKREICRPVGLFDFTCSYVIEYYTRPPRWKGWKLLRKGKGSGAEDPNGGREIAQKSFGGRGMLDGVVHKRNQKINWKSHEIAKDLPCRRGVCLPFIILARIYPSNADRFFHPRVSRPERRASFESLELAFPFYRSKILL